MNVSRTRSGRTKISASASRIRFGQSKRRSASVNPTTSGRVQLKNVNVKATRSGMRMMVDVSAFLINYGTANYQVASVSPIKYGLKLTNNVNASPTKSGIAN